MSAKQSNKIVVVLGAGRCGTSLMMQVLDKFGLSTSRNLVPPKAHNTKGPMEDADIAKIYDDFLQQIGSARVLPVSLEQVSDDLQRETRTKLRKVLIANKNASESIWGFKDPFTSYLLPLWFRVFNSTDTVPVFILVVRNPAQSVLSRKKHFGTLESVGELAWLANYSEALHHTAADCYIAHYEDWFTRGTEMAEELLDFTGLNEYFRDNRIEDALDSIVQENLNRSVYQTYDIQNETVRELYDVLKNCRGREFNRAGLMQTIEECRRIMHGFRGWYQFSQRAHQPRIASEELSEMKTKLSRRREANEKLTADLENLVRENNRLLIENSDLKAEIKNYRMHSIPTDQQIDGRQQLWQKECIILRQSYSFRLGQIIINAFKTPGKNTLLMPYYLVKLVLDMITGRGRDDLQKVLNDNSL